jgi:hypothetical protein
LFRIFPQNFIRGNAATNNAPNDGEKEIIEENSREWNRFNIIEGNICYIHISWALLTKNLLNVFFISNVPMI